MVRSAWRTGGRGGCGQLRRARRRGGCICGCLWRKVSSHFYFSPRVTTGISIGDTRLIWAPIALFVITILMYWHDQRIARR